MMITLSSSGHNSGIGSLEMEGLSILSYGPHYLPLGDLDKYGILRSRKEEPFVMKGREAFSYQAWTRTISPNNPELPGDLWLEQKMTGIEGEYALSITKEWLSESKPAAMPLAFVFFIAAEKAIVNENEQLLPGSLKHIRHANQPVAFYGAHNQLTILSQFSGEMELIPLAGPPHFWGATFMLAYHLPVSRVNRWTIHV